MGIQGPHRIITVEPVEVPRESPPIEPTPERVPEKVPVPAGPPEEDD